MCLLVNQIFKFLFNFIKLYSVSSCADPGIFAGLWGGGGGGGESRCIWHKKNSNVFFLFVCFSSFFLVLSLFYRIPMVNFKENYNFSRFQRRSNIFKGWSNFFERGYNCLFPIETGITCDFPGGPDVLSHPLNPHMAQCLRAVSNQQPWYQVLYCNTEPMLRWMINF